MVFNANYMIYFIRYCNNIQISIPLYLYAQLDIISYTICAVCWAIVIYQSWAR